MRPPNTHFQVLLMYFRPYGAQVVARRVMRTHFLVAESPGRQIFHGTDKRLTVSGKFEFELARRGKWKSWVLKIVDQERGTFCSPDSLADHL